MVTSLTEFCGPVENRSAAICLITILSIAVVSSPVLGRCDEPVAYPVTRTGGPHQPEAPRPIITGAAAAAHWLPELRVGVAVTRAQLPSGKRDETEVYGTLLWPLGRVDAASLRRPRAAVSRHSDLLDQIAALWRRAEADRRRGDLWSELDRQEAEAELEALTELEGQQ